MTRNGEVKVVDDVARAFVDLLADVRPATFALTGGSTAKACYEAIATSGVDCSGTDILISDERWVPVEHPDSNEGQARRAWLDHAPHGTIHSLREAGSTRERAASAYDGLLRSMDRLDMLHLGLGDDGHVASIFPGSATMGVHDRLVVPAGDDLHARERLTFTYAAISLADLVVVTAAGEGKREALARVVEGDTAMPATLIEAPTVIWLVDPAASGDTADEGRD